MNQNERTLADLITELIVNSGANIINGASD